MTNLAVNFRSLFIFILFDPTSGLDPTCHFCSHVSSRTECILVEQDNVAMIELNGPHHVDFSYTQLQWSSSKASFVMLARNM
jgi:hypothetical protein